MTASGIDTERVRDLAGRLGPKTVCVTPMWQNPTGITMDADTGTRFFIGEGGERNLRLTYCSSSERAITQGIKILGEVLHRRMSGVQAPARRQA